MGELGVGDLAEIVSAITVLVGLGFAVLQLRDYRAARDREAALELVHSFQTPEFAYGISLISGIPDGLGKAEIEARLGAAVRALYTVITTWESLGILHFRGELSIELIDDFFSGPITVSWRKLRRWVEDERRETGRGTYHEWFQWLAEQLARRESGTAPTPAYVAHKDWRPRR